MNKRLRILIHLVGSVTFILIAFISNSNWPDIEKILSTPTGFRSLTVQLECLAFFYLNYFVLIEKFYFRKKYVTYIVIVLILYILFMPVTRLLVDRLFEDYYLAHPDIAARRRGGVALMFSSRMYVFFLVMAFSFLLRLWQNFKDVREQKTTSELSFLKAQINPHFLFNTLNSIYSLSIQNSPDTPQAILRLSSMMRYVLKDTENNFVPLSKEIDYLRDFISLQELRMDTNVELEFKVKGEIKDQQIAPLLLIPFIENAFKYGVNAEESSHIEIRIDIDSECLVLRVKNSKVTTMTGLQEGTRLGLINAKKRLRLLYGNRYELSVNDNQQDYILKLKLYFDA